MMLYIMTRIIYLPAMTETSQCAWSSKAAGGAIPVVATVTGVAACFAEAILKKHGVLGSGAEVALALGQMVPFAILLRYFGSRLGLRQGRTSTQEKQ